MKLGCYWSAPFAQNPLLANVLQKIKLCQGSQYLGKISQRVDRSLDLFCRSCLGTEGYELRSLKLNLKLGTAPAASMFANEQGFVQVGK